MQMNADHTKLVFFDIDSQLDFLFPAGALYVPGAERVVPAIARLNRFAAEHGIPVVSTTDAHSEDDPEFKVWPHHCVVGTWGQRKAEATLLDKRVVVPNRPGIVEIAGAKQIIVEKQTVDVFAAPNLTRVVEQLGGDRYIVYGVVTEICVLFAVRGLLKLGKPVTVVTDAIETLKAEDSERALQECRLGGATLARTAEICAG
jgi:nicotinamidase/pyrazinamidase